MTYGMFNTLVSFAQKASTSEEHRRLGRGVASWATMACFPQHQAMSRRLLTFGSGSVPSTRPFAPRQQHC